jgi:hypothetical protein
VLYFRDAVFGGGQSNMGCYGSPTSAWPARERFDRNTGVASTFMYGYGHIANGWGDGSLLVATDMHNDNGHGMLFLSLAARMRDAGFSPSIYPWWHGGASSTELLADMTVANDVNELVPVATRFANRYAQIIQPRSACVVWSQGEHEAILGTATIWRTNTEASFAAIRAAFGMPHLRIYLIMIPTAWVPGPGSAPYVADMRAAALAIAAADPYVTVIDPGIANTTDGIHHNQPTHERVAELIVAHRLAA